MFWLSGDHTGGPISPYAQHSVVDSHYYSPITMVRTIEQILGIHPMNQKDSAATPMATAFTERPDLTPFTALPNRTSLTDDVKTEPFRVRAVKLAPSFRRHPHDI